MKPLWVWSIVLGSLIGLGCRCAQRPEVGPSPPYPALALETGPSALASPPAMADGSLYRPGMGDYFSDFRAHRQGDTLTVIVQESQRVTETDDVNLQKESQTKTSVKPKALGDITEYLPFVANQLSELDGSRKSKHTGKVKYEQNSRFSTRLTVLVTDVRPDGLLTIWGKKQLSLNGEQKVLTVCGLVNPADIGANNMIPSEAIALSAIHLEGEGTLSAASQPGLAAKNFQWLLDMLWPF